MNLLAAYYHDLNPILFEIGPLAIRWYGVSYVTSFVMAYFTLRWLAKRGTIELPPERVADALLYVILGVLVGGRLGYAIGYDQKLLYTFSSSFPYWDLLAIQRGGMASHGGMIGVIAASVFMARGFKNEFGVRQGGMSWRRVVDMMALCTPMGFFIGRIANFINGELLGKIVAGPGQDAPWWAVRFPQELLGWENASTPGEHAPALTAPQHAEFVRLVTENTRPGETWHTGLERVVAHAAEHRARLEPLLAARHPSQIYAALLEGVAVLIVVWVVAAKPRKAGVVGATWLLAYGVARVIDEVWRLPDAQFAVGTPMGLSRGQWYSVAMVVVGVGYLVWLWRKAEPRVGGWMKRRVG